MARVLRLMLAASMLVLLAQIYLSSSLRASSPAAVPPSQSANVMPRVTLEGGSLCHAAPWSLAHLRAQCQTGPLRYFYAYAALQSSWNAFQHIRRCHRHCTYSARVVSCAHVPRIHARPMHTRASHAYTACTPYASQSMLHSHLAAAGYVVTDERVLTGAPELIVTPNYWKPRAQDWRQWRLSPAQRINRMWGMEAVSKKDRLVHTLERRYGVGLCPLMPASFRWRELGLGLGLGLGF